jgi:hypothetical protein
VHPHSGVIGRKVDHEAGFDSRGDQAPVLDGDRVATEDGLMGKSDHLLAGVGGDEVVEELAVDLRTVSGKVACLAVAPRIPRFGRRGLVRVLGEDRRAPAWPSVAWRETVS